MSDHTLNRRKFISNATTLATLSATGLALPVDLLSKNIHNPNKPIRLGFVGIGGRGSFHLDVALGIEGVEVPAICEIKPERLYQAKRWIEESGRPTPKLYGNGPTDFKRMCEDETLDAVICVTSWEWHAPVLLAAMNNDKHGVSEVPIIQTMEEAWELVETYERTGKWASMVIGGWGDMTLLNMVRKNLLGEIIHAEGGYVHDLRRVKFDPDEEPWRLQHSIDRNGNLYPDHPMRTIMLIFDINHGDRFDHLVSMSSKSIMLNEYARDQYGDASPYAEMKMSQGDYNATLIRTVDGKLVTLNFDTNTPHPRENLRIQGSKGVYLRDRGNSRIYIEGQSPVSHSWEDAEPYLKEYIHPLDQNYVPLPRTGGSIRGHGSSDSKTPIYWTRLINALREDKVPDWDVYDSVTSSAISPLSEASVAANSKTVDFPDFTKGKWKTRTPLFSE